MSKPVTKEDIIRLNNWQSHLVPLKTLRDGKKINNDVLRNTIDISPERLELTSSPESDHKYVRHVIEDVCASRKR